MVFRFSKLLNLLETKYASQYMVGTTTKVRKVANDKPYIMVQAMGPHIAVLSPPINICGSDCEISVKKLKLKPTAKGTNPNTVVMAVNNTGRSLVAPP